jgi:hypothetical protein
MQCRRPAEVAAYGAIGQPLGQAAAAATASLVSAGPWGLLLLSALVRELPAAQELVEVGSVDERRGLDRVDLAQHGHDHRGAGITCVESLDKRAVAMCIMPSLA